MKKTAKTPMQISPEGIDFIKARESLELQVYRCSAGYRTIGYGHRIRPGEYLVAITAARAQELLEKDLQVFEDGVNALVTVPLEQHQFDALVSFAFNVGLDIDADTKAEGLGDSTLLKKLNAGDVAGAAEQFDEWAYAVERTTGRKVVLRGLKNRRALERALFAGGFYS